MQIIKNEKILENDNINILSITASVDDVKDYSVVPCALLADNQYLLKKYKSLSVWIGSHNDVRILDSIITVVSAVFLEFKSFADGRAYSQAYILRKRLNYTGDIYAFGDFGKDQMCFLKRSGFNAFIVPNNKSAEELLLGIKDFSVYYQTSADKNNCKTAWQLRKQ